MEDRNILVFVIILLCVFNIFRDKDVERQKYWCEKTSNYFYGNTEKCK